MLNRSERHVDDMNTPQTSFLGVMKIPVVFIAVLGLVGTLFQAPLANLFRAADTTTPIGLMPNLPSLTFGDFVEKNYDCFAQNSTFQDTPIGAQIGSIICPNTGDLLIEIVFIDSTTGQKDKVLAAIFVDETIRNGRSGLVVSDAGELAPVPSALFAAFAAPSPGLPRSIKPEGQLEMATNVSVRCTALPNNGTLVRVLDEGGQCVMETINTSNGQIISRQSVSCNQTCS